MDSVLKVVGSWVCAVWRDIHDISPGISSTLFNTIPPIKTAITDLSEHKTALLLWQLKVRVTYHMYIACTSLSLTHEFTRGTY